MSWNLKAELIESCSCNMFCPCWFGPAELAVMDQGWCAFPQFYRIEEGSADGVDLSGCTVVVACDFPGPTLYDGNGTGRIYINEGTTDAQRQALEAVFQGQKGGPMSIIAGLLTTWLPTQYAKVEIEEEGDSFVATVGEFGRVESNLLRNEAGENMSMQNAGFFSAFQFKNQTGQMAPSNSHWYDPEMPRPYETRSGLRASCEWQGE